MHFAGSERLRGTREQVWALVTDPNAVARCVPGLERMEVVDPSTFKAVVKAGLGPVRGTFSFDVSWKELRAPEHARMAAQGKTPGSAVTVDSSMDLDEVGEGETELSWSADVVVHGTIASVGARLMNGFVEKQTQQFFACLAGRLRDAPE